jgi:hypothetical protein
MMSLNGSRKHLAMEDHPEEHRSEGRKGEKQRLSKPPGVPKAKTLQILRPNARDS